MFVRIVLCEMHYFYCFKMVFIDKFTRRFAPSQYKLTFPQYKGERINKTDKANVWRYKCRQNSFLQHDAIVQVARKAGSGEVGTSARPPLGKTLSNIDHHRNNQVPRKPNYSLVYLSFCSFAFLWKTLEIFHFFRLWDLVRTKEKKRREQKRNDTAYVSKKLLNRT